MTTSVIQFPVVVLADRKQLDSFDTSLLQNMVQLQILTAVFVALPFLVLGKCFTILLISSAVI